MFTCWKPQPLTTKQWWLCWALNNVKILALNCYVHFQARPQPACIAAWSMPSSGAMLARCPLTLADSNPSSWGSSCCKESQLFIPLAKSLAQSWHREKSWDHCASHPLPGVVDPQLLQRTHLVHIWKKNSFGKNYLLLSSSFCAFNAFHHYIKSQYSYFVLHSCTEENITSPSYKTHVVVAFLLT